MKLLTCVVPCYNSAAYMERTIGTLLVGGEEMEILIVDDGSTDDTGAIADRLAAEHPAVIRVHHQPNAGHGSAINYGVEHGEGVFFKVVDSDDRLDEASLPGTLDVLRAFSAPGNQPDLVIHDYVYDHTDQKAVFSVTYRGRMKEDALCAWDDTRRFHIWNQFMIHSLIYRRQFLRDIPVRMPERTFYEDNLYIYQPLRYTRRILYHRAPLYGYFIGRSDQSINEQNILRRLDQLTAMVKRMITTYTLEELNTLPRHLRGHMINTCCSQLVSTCSLHFIEDSPRSREMNRDLWQSIRAFDPALYKALRRNPLGRVSCLPGRLGERLLVFLYRLGRKVIRF